MYLYGNQLTLFPVISNFAGTKKVKRIVLSGVFVCRVLREWLIFQILVAEISKLSN